VPDTLPDGVIDIRMPKLNNNDAAYVLLAWLVPSGKAVSAGDTMAEAETSKAVEELAATGDGLLEQLVTAGAECVPGQLIARLHPDATTFGAAAAPTPVAAAATADGPMVTAPAAALIAEWRISPETVRSWGLAVVRRDDVERLAAPASDTTMDIGTTVDIATAAAGTAAAGTAAAETTVSGTPTDETTGADVVTTALPRVQRGVANAVTIAHREIPAAFTVAEVDVTDALAAVRALTKAHRTLIGLAELTVAAIGARREPDAACFAALTPDGRSSALRAGAHIGVTFDLGQGLYVPVVRDADRLGFGDLARTLTEHRLAALRGTFHEHDLQGANIALTLNTDPGIVFAGAIVFPGQACALSLAAPRAVAVPDGADGFRARQLVHVGIAFDHRIVNGTHASALLRGVKTLLESAEFLASLAPAT
jgi:2-oxoglutarate dehydrogenase E2 component (dihydrolipoamide succinyltransferase)